MRIDVNSEGDDEDDDRFKTDAKESFTLREESAALEMSRFFP